MRFQAGKDLEPFGQGTLRAPIVLELSTTAAAVRGASFIRALAFAGAKSGYVFKCAEHGLGYYADDPPTSNQGASVEAEAPAIRVLRAAAGAAPSAAGASVDARVGVGKRSVHARKPPPSPKWRGDASEAVDLTLDDEDENDEPSPPKKSKTEESKPPRERPPAAVAGAPGASSTWVIELSDDEDGGVELLGECTREQRNDELRKHAVDVDEAMEALTEDEDDDGANVQVDPRSMAELVDMGFAPERARAALARVKGVAEAIDMLLRP